ncbi:MAG: helix-turn-helix transcriptional regulator [Erysipelotrichaceae bacterium]|nr:helix-turn-helix transcriptional regulator [Erysipelotrichaceae bacterium]
MAEIYEKLKMMREEAGLRQGQIADYLGVTQTFISKVESGERNLTVDQLESIVNLYGYSLAAFADMEKETHPIRFAFRAQDVSQDDLHVIAEIGKIAINSRFMAKFLEESDIG